MMPKFYFIFILVIVLCLVATVYYYDFDSHKYFYQILAGPSKKLVYYRQEHYRKNTSTSNYVTVVSSYFRLNNSKHSTDEYQKWLRNFFLSVSAPLVIFTDGRSIDIDLIVKSRANYSTTLYITDSHWNILSDIEMNRNKSYYLIYNIHQWKIDPEKNIHNPNLYLIWNMKSYITSKIAKENPYNSKIFIYSDAGAWRHSVFLGWPDLNVVKNITKKLNNKILFAQITNSNLEKSPHFPFVNLIEGGFFMGCAEAIEEFSNSFWRIHDQFLNEGLFIGKDQNIMNAIAFSSKYNKSVSVARLKTWQRNCASSEWFFYQNFLASDSLYSCSRPRENLVLF